MNDEIRIPVSLPLDDDGFLRRECPTCEQEFKWYGHGEGSGDAEQVNQYFCPRCGVGADLDQWWTPAQLEYGRGVAAPAMDEAVNGLIDDLFKSVRNGRPIRVKRTGRFSFDIPTPEPLAEPNDMVIMESPCHPNEPVKVPAEATFQVYCLICGTPFAA